jgi:hypothetical protein
MRNLNWFEPGIALNAAELASAQERLQIRFPPDYARIVMANSGASNPDESEFEYLDGGSLRVGNFGSLLALRQDQSETIFEAMEDLGDQLPEGVVPVIETGSGDYVCLDFRDYARPAIVYFNHERPPGEALIYLDSTFTDFLQRLRVPETE